MPAGDGFRWSSAGGENANQKSDAKSDANGLIRMFADELIGGARTGDAALLQLAARLLRRFEGGYEFLARRCASLTEVIRAGPEKILAVAYDLFQILEKFFC